MTAPIRLVDLFAGIGGIRLGVENAASRLGVSTECVFTSEWDKWANKTYAANWPGETIHGDITAIAEADIPDHDLLLAGFPCQPFSQAGHKQGFSDTRGTLFFDIERILQAKQPRAFLLENVKNLAGHDGGRTLRVIMERLLAVGYPNAAYRVLRARDFGLPQNRERVYIVGFLGGRVPFSFPLPTQTPTRLGNILEATVSEKYTISDRLWEGHQRRKQENKLKGKGFGYGLFSADSSYTNTISARYYKDGSEILIAQEGKNPRKLTPREAARLQGFPDHYIFPETVSDAQRYKQLGNSVPVNVIEAIATQIIPYLYPDPEVLQ